MRIAILLLALIAAGCTSAPQRAEPSPGAAQPRARLLDRGCFDDCMGTNAGKEFCEDRCTY